MYTEKKVDVLRINLNPENEIFEKSQLFGKIRTSYSPKKVYHVAIHFKALFITETMVPISK